jgi:hypothetical protein
MFVTSSRTRGSSRCHARFIGSANRSFYIKAGGSILYYHYQIKKGCFAAALSIQIFL